MPHITTICQVRFPKLEKRLANVFRRSIFIFPPYVPVPGKKKETLATALCL